MLRGTSRDTYFTLYRYYIYITSGATIDTCRRSCRAIITASTLDLTGGRAYHSVYNTITWRNTVAVNITISQIYDKFLRLRDRLTLAVRATRECAETPR